MKKSHRKYRIKSKFRFITFIVVVLSLTVGIVGYFTGFSISVAQTVGQSQQIQIVAGDTLWDIANEYKSEDTDTRYAVYSICHENDIQADEIQPGMTLIIPDRI